MKEQARKEGLTKRILKITAVALAAAIILPLAVIFAGRGINAVRFNISDGVQERYFVMLGGIEQKIHIRGESENNPVVIWLHGGPGWSCAYELALWQYMMENDFTFVRWDQRGSGRTHSRNPGAPLSLDILIADLDDLVKYVTARFGQPVYIVGDSWGSNFGITYASRHPENIAGFVGVGQFINSAQSNRIAIETASERAIAAGNFNDAEQMWSVYERIRGKGFADVDFTADLDDFVLIQHLPAPYLAPRYESQGAGIVFSPWFGFHEIRELISVFLVSNRTFFDRNRPLFYEIDNFVPPESLEVPVAFIMGSEDFITNTSLVADYYSRLEAPSISMFIIEGAGHSPYRVQPELFAEKLREALAGFREH